MKILHTSDIHLRSIDDDRFKTFLTLLEVANNNNIDVFVISGDLFDDIEKGFQLISNMRGILSTLNFELIIIPGNHDAKLYNQPYFGDNVHLLTSLESPLEKDNVVFWGFPYEDISDLEIMNKLMNIADKLDDNKTNILLFHGELLDTFFAPDDFGESKNRKYMPIKLSFFKELDFSYVLAGHFHSKFIIKMIDDKKYFVYPGSPIAITKREIGQRKVNIFEVGEPPDEYDLDTFHYEELTIKFSPLDTSNPIDKLTTELKNFHKDACILLTLDGFIDRKILKMTEKELKQDIENKFSQRIIIKEYNVRDISILQKDELYYRFKIKLDQLECDQEVKDELLKIAIDGMVGID